MGQVIVDTRYNLMDMVLAITEELGNKHSNKNVNKQLQWAKLL